MWFFNKKRQVPRSLPISFENNHDIYHVAQRHAGHYFCYGQYENSEKHFLSHSELRVYGMFAM